MLRFRFDSDGRRRLEINAFWHAFALLKTTVDDQGSANLEVIHISRNELKGFLRHVRDPKRFESVLGTFEVAWDDENVRVRFAGEIIGTAKRIPFEAFLLTLLEAEEEAA